MIEIVIGIPQLTDNSGLSVQSEIGPIFGINSVLYPARSMAARSALGLLIGQGLKESLKLLKALAHGFCFFGMKGAHIVAFAWIYAHIV